MLLGDPEFLTHTRNFMDRLAELRAELAALLARTKAMLEEFPGPSWGTQHNAEWNTHMHRFNQLNSEIKTLEDELGAVPESSPVPRGIQSVRAQVDDIPTVIEGLNAAFNDFKTKHNDRLDQLEAAVDTASTRAAAHEINGPVAVVAPTLGPKAMRAYADFKAHFATKEGESTERVSITDFVRGVAGMKSTTAVHAALSIGTNTAGGYTVPAQTMPQILNAMTPVSSLLLAGAGIVAMEEGASSVTTAVMDTIPTASWRLERGDVAESDPTFRGVKAVPQSLAFYFRVSRELLADGQGIEAALTVAIAQAFAKALDYAGLRGSGVAPEPLGIKNTPGVQKIANGTNGAALAGYASFMAAAEGMLTANAPMPTAAIMAPRSLIKLAGLTDSTGQPLRRPELLANLPMIATPQIPINLPTGTSTDTSEIYLGDFTKMYFLMREALSIQLLRELFAKTGELAFLCHVRADVVIPQPAAFTVITGVRA
jgi:HK97 family phage major capsid protein